MKSAEDAENEPSIVTLTVVSQLISKGFQSADLTWHSSLETGTFTYPDFHLDSTWVFPKKHCNLNFGDEDEGILGFFHTLAAMISIVIFDAEL